MFQKAFAKMGECHKNLSTLTYCNCSSLSSDKFWENYLIENPENHKCCAMNCVLCVFSWKHKFLPKGGFLIFGDPYTTVNFSYILNVGYFKYDEKMSKYCYTIHKNQHRFGATLVSYWKTKISSSKSKF